MQHKRGSCLGWPHAIVNETQAISQILSSYIKKFSCLEDEPGKKKIVFVIQSIHGLEYREESNQQLLKHANPSYSQGMIRGEKTLCRHGGKE